MKMHFELDLVAYTYFSMMQYATVSLSQSQYSVVETDTSLTVGITLSSTASENVMVEVTIIDRSANGNVGQYNNINQILY